MSSSHEMLVFGAGQLGQLYAAGALRLGIRVWPLTRQMDADQTMAAFPDGHPILLGVAEASFADALRKIPDSRRQDVVLVQNELFPAQLAEWGLDKATVLTVWLSKKKGRPIEVARTSSAYGRHAALFHRMHQALELPSTVLTSAEELHTDIAAKFTFILTINALGLVENLSLGQWLEKDHTQVSRLIDEARALAQMHLQANVDAAQTRQRVMEAMEGLHDYPAKGRSAKARLSKALDDAARFELDLPCLRQIANGQV